jgi:hypothetical protein
MNRGRITFLSITVACLLTVFLLGSVWLMYYSDRGAPFELPPVLPSDSVIRPPASAPGLGGLTYTPLTVDAQNIQTLLASVERHGSYRRMVESVFYWPGGEERITHQWAQRNGVTRVESHQPGRPVQNRIFAEGVIYEWIGGSMAISELTPGDADAEAISFIPTWETIAAFPPDRVLEAEYLNLPGERCLLVRTREPVYYGEYVISLENGLLLRASFTDFDGNLAYEVRSAPPAEGDPGNHWFTLPDGRRID